MRSLRSRRREDEEDDLKELYPALATACEIRLYTSRVASTIVSINKNCLFVPSGSLGWGPKIEEVIKIGVPCLVFSLQT